ncbi:stage II sporulation protein M [Halostagnicola bangensis]
MNGPERDDDADDRWGDADGTDGANDQTADGWEFDDSSPKSANPAEQGDSDEPGNPPAQDDGSMFPNAGPDAVRNWTALLATLAVVSFVSAVTTLVVYDAMMATLGAAILGSGLVLAAVVSRSVFPQILHALSDAWAEHRRYVSFSGGLFALGIASGVALAAAGVDLTELFMELILEEFGEEELNGVGGEPSGLEGEGKIELSAMFFILNNTPPYLASILGALTLGLFTFFIMTFNGLIVGNIAVAIGAEVGYGLIIALLVPHGIFELTALFIAAGVGFRFLYRAGERITGKRSALFTKPYLARTTLLVIFGWLMLVVAAFVEAYLTIPIAELFFPGQAE